MTLLPPGKRFAFSVLDDTDDATLENIAPIYSLLRDYGFRTTKTVWPLDCPEGSRNFFAAETLQDKRYLDFVHGLHDAGFEIAFHGATMESSRRERTVEGLEVMRREFGRYPRLFCNHGQNLENLYWGAKRFQSAPMRLLGRVVFRDRGHRAEGDQEGSPFFWGDVCREIIQYVRNFTFDRLDMLRINPGMPYQLASTPYVRAWFSTSDAPDVHAFNRVLAPERLDELEASGGVGIISTHFGKGFTKDGRVNSTTERLLRRLADMRGWFVPVSELLDRLLDAGRGHRLTSRELLRLELRFVADRVRHRRGRGI